VFDENTWDLLRIHDDGDDGDGGDDDDVLAEDVSSHFVYTATRCRTNKSDGQTYKSHNMRRHIKQRRSFKDSFFTLILMSSIAIYIRGRIRLEISNRKLFLNTKILHT